MFRSQFFQKLLGDATIPVFAAVYLIYLAYTKEYRQWWIYKAIMGSNAKTQTRDDPLLPRKKKPDPPADTPTEDDPKN